LSVAVVGNNQATQERFMNDDDKREIIQLFLVAKYEFNLGKKAYNKLDSSKIILKMIDINEDIKKNGINENNKKLIFLISHFSSSCLRLSTIYEVLNLKPKDKDLYSKLIKQSNKLDYLCFYLRDNIAHKEPEDNDTHIIRQNLIDKLTVKDIYEGTFNTINKIIQIIRSIKKNFNDIIKYIK